MSVLHKYSLNEEINRKFSLGCKVWQDVGAVYIAGVIEAERIILWSPNI